MKKTIGTLLLVMLVMISSVGCKNQVEKPELEEPKVASLEEMEAIALAYVGHLIAAEYDNAYSDYAHDEVMQKAVNAEVYQQIMEGLYTQVGDPIEILTTVEWEAQGYQIVQVAVEFTKKPFGMNVVFNEFGEISGLNYSELAKVPDTEGKELTESYTVESISVGPFDLEGQIMFPIEVAGNKPVPLVILVHGSGATDKDETIGPNKPFMDLAEGLAAQGIASLRFDKRTLSHPESFAGEYEFTVWEETIEDALAAIEIAKADSQINENQIFVLGHSLGGYLLPKMMKHTNEVAGWIFMAASNQPLQGMIVDQYTYLAELDGETSQAEADQIAQVAAIAKQADSPEGLDKQTPILGAYPGYWIDLNAYHPLQEVKLYTTPKLFLQGERDYQVPPAQFDLWKNSIGEAHAEFVLFDQLNHLMMPGEGDPNPGEYQLPNHVDERVVYTIAEFVNRVK
ncbi:DUF3887 domain-containing protein [Gottschalkiaceae bacterium SANA]|nr:DUF3887 domain-containing protein [Gottschalkiaceae bacterium SANA]